MIRYLTSVITIIILLQIIACSTMNTEKKQALEKDKKIALINIELGMAYLSKNDLQRAKQKLLYAIDKDPKLPESWYALAYYYEKTGNNSDAKRYYLKAISLAPHRGDVLNNYGTYLCRHKQYIESVGYFLAATQDRQYLDTAGAYENAGLCALHIPNHKKAAEYFNRAIEEDPTRTISMNELSKLSH